MVRVCAKIVDLDTKMYLSHLCRPIIDDTVTIAMYKSLFVLSTVTGTRFVFRD